MARSELEFEEATVRNEGGEPARGVYQVSRVGERGTRRLAGGPGPRATSA